MLNWWLIVLLILIILLCFGIGIYVLFYFVSEEDDGEAHVAKAIVVLGMVVTTGVVLLLPFDVANSPDPTVANKYINTINVQLLWQIVFWIVLSMTLVIVPFTMFFYEAYDPDKPNACKQVTQAVIYTIGIAGAFAIACGVCHAFIGEAQLPIHFYSGVPQLVDDPDKVVYTGWSVASEVNIKVALFTYCVGFLCFIGWIAFIIYGGVGLVSFPIDLLVGFARRTKAISGSRFAQEMAIIAAKGDALLGMALELQKSARGTVTSSQRRKINILRKETYILEAQQDQLIWAYTQAGGSPFIVYGRLVLGIISLIISVSWMLHIFLYNVFEISPFLNVILVSLDDVFALFGVIAYGVLVFYLMWVTFEGQIRLGMRLLFFQIHPVKPHDTTLNSLLFNVSLALLTSTAIVGFAARSFQEYCAWTAISSLMNVYLLHLRFIGYALTWAPVALPAVSLATLPLVLLCPAHKRRKDPTLLRLDK